MQIAVKICGIMSPEHGRAALAAGADAIGLVFAPSRRRVTLDQAAAIAAEVRAAGSVQLVGVFVNEQPALINRIVAEIGLDRVQLSGHEELAGVAEIRAPLVKAIRFDEHPSEEAWLVRAEQPGSAATPYTLLVDANVAGSFGGAGVTGDWQRAAALARRWPVWLAGGLSPANVAGAVARVRPQLVDVSSGVETDGVKDIAKIEAFIRAAKQAGHAVV